MSIFKTEKNVLAFVFQLGAFSALLAGQSCPSPGGVCLPSVAASCVSDCSQQCGDDGECIFGCQIGQFTSVSQCTFDCNGLGDSCNNSCLKTVQCIAAGCSSNVTNEVMMNLGAIVYNRATGVWQQTVKIANATSETLCDLGFILDTLATGWTVTNSDGATTGLLPAGSPYKNYGDLAPGATATITLQFTRTGTPMFTYSPRVVIGTGR